MNVDPLPGRALDGDLAAHQPREAATDREPEPRAVGAAGVTPFGLHEGREDRLELVFGAIPMPVSRTPIDDPWPLAVQVPAPFGGVADSPTSMPISAAGLGELHRVGQQVGEDLEDAVVVADELRGAWHVDRRPEASARAPPPAGWASTMAASTTSATLVGTRGRRTCAPPRPWRGRGSRSRGRAGAARSP